MGQSGFVHGPERARDVAEDGQRDLGGQADPVAEQLLFAADQLVDRGNVQLDAEALRVLSDHRVHDQHVDQAAGASCGPFWGL